MASPLLGLRQGKGSIMAESIWSKLDGGVVIESEYSGMGCMEQAAAMIRQAVELQSPSPRRCFEVHRVCDSDPRCRHVLRCHAAEREHWKHSFSDICDQIDPLVFGRLAGRFSSMGCRGEAGVHLHRKSLLSRKCCGEAMVEEMCMILEKATFLRKSFCGTHDRECDLHSGATSVTAAGGN